MGIDTLEPAKYARRSVETIEDLRLEIGPDATRSQAEALWLLLGDAGVLTRSGSGAIVGLLSTDEWDRWCDKAWRHDKAHQR